MTSLEQLSLLARELADQLTAAAAGGGAGQALNDPPRWPGSSASGISGLAGLARRYLQLRRARDTLFPEGLFSDPAWDLLLDLFAAEAEGAAISVSSACIAAAVPPTTALRWIRRLEACDLLLRGEDASDHRRVLLHLTPSARTAIRVWLEALSGPALPDTGSKSCSPVRLRGI